MVYVNFCVRSLFLFGEPNLHCFARVEWHINIAEHDPMIALENRSLFFLLEGQELKVMRLAFAAIVRREGEAEERSPFILCRRQGQRLTLERPRPGWCLLECRLNVGGRLRCWLAFLDHGKLSDAPVLFPRVANRQTT